MKTSRDKNLLRAKASVTALLEMKDNDVNNLLYELYNDKLTDQMIKDDISRNLINI